MFCLTTGTRLASLSYLVDSARFAAKKEKGKKEGFTSPRGRYTLTVWPRYFLPRNLAGPLYFAVRTSFNFRRGDPLGDFLAYW